MLIRQAEHESSDVAFAGQGQQPRGIGGEGLALRWYHAGRQLAVGVRHGDTDSLGAEVGPIRAASFRPGAAASVSGKIPVRASPPLSTQMTDDAKQRSSGHVRQHDGA